jgi:hypothetical protein
MLLVPRQLQRVGMTGNVPYYGGRFTPAQAYAAAHPARPPAAAQHTADPATTQDALRHLRDSGVLTDDEYTELLGRVKA